MKLSDTFPKKAPYRVVLAMPIEVEVMAADRDEAEDEARPHAFEVLQQLMAAKDLDDREFEVLSMEIYPDLD
jgi:hypothetical protein